MGMYDYSKAMPHHEGIIRDGGSVCIFPEGRTTKDGNIGEGKGGVAYLAWATVQIRRRPPRPRPMNSRPMPTASWMP
ncbi:MAG: 1-acyl-sn-glycerol-3-phosphate acyltransferase [Patescibacteria group bacterium]|nr:1-acyl-sn-glycerol-3-phosphate acyltransferase [Patescibacteria group bacterium]